MKTNLLLSKILKSQAFVIIMSVVCNVSAQTGSVCNAPNILSGRIFQTENAIYSPGWTPSNNYTCTMKNGLLSVFLGDATYDAWQAQFFLSVNSEVSLNPDEEYCISFDIESNVDLPRVLIKFFKDGNNENFIELGNSLKPGKQTISGTVHNTGNTTLTQIDKLLFDFGGNPANATIVISNIAIHGNNTVTAIKHTPTNTISITPNPVKDVMYIRGLCDNTRVKVLNTSGVICIDQISTGEINTTSLPQGVYFVMINNRIFRIIKQ